MKCDRRFKMQALTSCDAKVMSTRTAIGQFKVSSRGQAHPISGVVMDVAAFKVSHSMDVVMDVDIDAAALRAARARSKSIGAMDESSGQGQKASTR
jgi:hypothetical protein